MKRNKIIFSIVFIMVVILSLYSYYIYSKQNEYIDIKQKQSFSILQQIIDGKIIFFRKLISKRLSSEIKANDRLKEYIINDDRKYEDELFEVFKILKKENKYITSLHFFSEQNICKYEFPSKDHKGKGEYKRITQEVNTLKRAKYGFELDEHALLYRLVIPIKYDGKYYGILELGVDPEIFVSDMTVIEKYLDSTIFVDLGKIDKYKNHDIKNKYIVNNKYVLFEDKPLFKKILEDELLDGNLISFSNENYKLFKYELLNFDGEVEGTYLITSYVTDDKKWVDDLFLLTIWLLVVLIILIFIVIYFGFSYYDKKINVLMAHEKQNERILFQQSKMASMGEMIGNIAHQWRQPLSTITTAASGMKMQKDYNILTDKNFANSIDMIMKQADHMSRTIDDFRNFFQSDKEATIFNIKKAVLKDINLLEASLKNHSIIIKVDIDKKLEIKGHQNEFTQAILNIINNSKDQLNKTNPYDKVIKISAKNEGDFLQLFIHDNGGGVSGILIDKIFEPYFTTKHQSQGTGIGLFMTSEIITKHFFGKIEVENRDMKHGERNYKGACFIISFPIIENSSKK